MWVSPQKLACPHNMALVPPRASDPDNKLEALVLFAISSRKSQTPTVFSVRRTALGDKNQEARVTGVTLEVGHHRCLPIRCGVVFFPLHGPELVHNSGW